MDIYIDSSDIANIRYIGDFYPFTINSQDYLKQPFIIFTANTLSQFTKGEVLDPEQGINIYLDGKKLPLPPRIQRRLLVLYRFGWKTVTLEKSPAEPPACFYIMRYIASGHAMINLPIKQMSRYSKSLTDTVKQLSPGDIVHITEVSAIEDEINTNTVFYLGKNLFLQWQRSTKDAALVFQSADQIDDQRESNVKYLYTSTRYDEYALPTNFFENPLWKKYYSDWVDENPLALEEASKQ